MLLFAGNEPLYSGHCDIILYSEDFLKSLTVSRSEFDYVLTASHCTESKNWCEEKSTDKQ